MKSSKNNDFACKIDINFKEKRTNLFHYAFVGVLLNFCHNFIGESEGLLYKITPASIFLTFSSTDVSDQGCKTKKPIKYDVQLRMKSIANSFTNNIMRIKLKRNQKVQRHRLVS